MIGPFGFECMEQYSRQYNTLLAPEICICADCVAAEIALPSILAWEGKRLRDFDGKEQLVNMGRWLHGTERKVYAEMRERAHAIAAASDKARSDKR